MLAVVALALLARANLSERVTGLLELDDSLSTITARLDEIEMRQQEKSFWRWTVGYANANHQPSLRDRRRALRRARQEITQAMLLEWDPYIWEDEPYTAPKEVWDPYNWDEKGPETP